MPNLLKSSEVGAEGDTVWPMWWLVPRWLYTHVNLHIWGTTTRCVLDLLHMWPSKLQLHIIPDQPNVTPYKLICQSWYNSSKYRGIACITTCNLFPKAQHTQRETPSQEKQTEGTSCQLPRNEIQARSDTGNADVHGPRHCLRNRNPPRWGC